jgi:hypothetical protein
VTLTRLGPHTYIGTRFLQMVDFNNPGDDIAASATGISSTACMAKCDNTSGCHVAVYNPTTTSCHVKAAPTFGANSANTAAGWSSYMCKQPRRCDARHCILMLSWSGWSGLVGLVVWSDDVMICQIWCASDVHQAMPLAVMGLGNLLTAHIRPLPSPSRTPGPARSLPLQGQPWRGTNITSAYYTSTDLSTCTSNCKGNAACVALVFRPSASDCFLMSYINYSSRTASSLHDTVCLNTCMCMCMYLCCRVAQCVPPARSLLGVSGSASWCPNGMVSACHFTCLTCVSDRSVSISMAPHGSWHCRLGCGVLATATVRCGHLQVCHL